MALGCPTDISHYAPRPDSVLSPLVKHTTGYQIDKVINFGQEGTVLCQRYTHACHLVFGQWYLGSQFAFGKCHKWESFGLTYDNIVILMEMTLSIFICDKSEIKICY